MRELTLPNSLARRQWTGQIFSHRLLALRDDGGALIGLTQSGPDMTPSGRPMEAAKEQVQSEAEIRQQSTDRPERDKSSTNINLGDEKLGCLAGCHWILKWRCKKSRCRPVANATRW